MAINLYDFHDIIRETYNEYVSRYEIDLVDFKNEYGTDSEPKFIEYQRVYLGKMRDYIIENLSKIDNEDLDSQFYHDKLQEALSDNKKMFQFLNFRLNPMNYISEQKENTSKDEYLEFFENLNNNKITESGMIKFIKSHESILELETLIRDTDKFIDNYTVGEVFNNWESFQFDEAYKSPLSKESFTTFKELVLSKIEELKNDTSSFVENKNKPKKTLVEENWFIAGLADATGELERLISKLGSVRKAAIDLGLPNHNYLLNLTYKDSSPKTRDIYSYCVENNIETTNEFKEIVSQHQKLNKNIDW